MWCGTCGRAAEAGALFCGGCGGRLPAAETPAPAEAGMLPVADVDELPTVLLRAGAAATEDVPAAAPARAQPGAPVAVEPWAPPVSGPQEAPAVYPAQPAPQTAPPVPEAATATYAGTQPQYHYTPPQHPHQAQYQQQGGYQQAPHSQSPYPQQAAAPPPPGPNGLFAQVGEHVSRMTGVGPVEGLEARELFSAVFQKKAEEDIEEYFLVGTQTTTPPLTSVKAVWPKPWVFYKTFIFSVTVFAGFLMAWSMFKNANILPGLWVIGSFVIPLSVVMFYFEMNITRNISLYQVMKMVTLGGVLSLIASLIGFKTTSLGEMIGAMAAGPIEECGKLAALVLVVKNQRYPWTLNGLLLGGAVGAGFAGFESAGYAFNVMMGSDSDTAMMWNMFLRGVLAPGGHVAWTALVGAALWRVKGSEPFHTGMLTDKRFVRVLLFAVGLHVIWNSPLFSEGVLGIVKCAVLGVAAWAAVLAFVQDGIKQVQHAQAAANQADGGAHAAAVNAMATEIAASSGRLVLSAGAAAGPQQVAPPPAAPVG